MSPPSPNATKYGYRASSNDGLDFFSSALNHARAEDISRAWSKALDAVPCGSAVSREGWLAVHVGQRRALDGLDLHAAKLHRHGTLRVQTACVEARQGRLSLLQCLARGQQTAHAVGERCCTEGGRDAASSGACGAAVAAAGTSDAVATADGNGLNACWIASGAAAAAEADGATAAAAADIG